VYGPALLLFCPENNLNNTGKVYNIHNKGRIMAEKEKQDGFSRLKKLVHPFSSLSIVRKIFYGYISLALLIIIISAFTLSRLEKLNVLSGDIVKRDSRVIEITEGMTDNLSAQELFARRYIILNSPDIFTLVKSRSREFKRLADELQVLPGEYKAFAGRIASLHEEYDRLLDELPSYSVKEEYYSKIHQKQIDLIWFLKEVSDNARNAQHKKIRMTERIGARAVKVAGVICGAGIILSISAALLITRNISRSVNQLKHATEEISAGRFEYIPDIRNRDELGELAHAFTEMAKRLKELEEAYLDKNPLTRLPGGIAIEKEIIKRIASGTPAAFCFADLDNFKAYNDRYSYARGSGIIMATARIIEKVISETGTREDFIGHIGGDDYMFSTAPERYPLICNAVIKHFDIMVRGHYDQEDLKRGHIISKNRQGQEMRFPIMTISIAVVNSLNSAVLDHIRLGEIAAELKEYAKSLPGSVCVADRRQDGGPEEGKVIQFPTKTG